MLTKIAIVAVAVFGVLAGVAGATKVSNGDFEKGTLQGWKQESTDAGTWQILDKDGLDDRPAARGIPAAFKPLHGKFSAITAQEFISRQILYRTIKLDGDKKNELNFKLAYLNSANDFVAPNSFDLGLDNQQLRIDLIKPSAGLKSTKDSDVLKRVLVTKPGDRLELNTKTISTNLTPLGGGNVKLRFVVVATDSSLNATIDDVKVKSKNR